MSLRILHLTPSLSAGGAERQLSLLAPAMAAGGLKVTVAYGTGGPNLRHLQGGAVDLVALPDRGHHDPRILWDLRKVILQSRAQLVQTWNLQMDVMGGLAAHSLGVAHILSERCSAELYAPGWKTRLRLAIGRRARAIVANSEGGLDYWRAHGVSSGLHLVRNGITPAGSAAPANDFGLGLAAPLLAVGRLTEQKNVLRLIQAMGTALKVLPQQRALILGDGPLRESAQALIRSLGMDQRIVLGGVSDAVGWWMSHAAVMVSASLYEGHPNVVIEAAAAGCPLVLSDIAAHREVLGPEEALYAAPEDPDGLAAAIVAAATNLSAARQRATRARAAVAGLTFEGAAQAYARIYNDVLL